MSIPYGERRAVYEAAIAYFGTAHQIWKAVEEMAELIKELSHCAGKGLAHEALVDEIADVTVMMEQLRLIFYANAEIQDRIDFKVNRLAERLHLVSPPNVQRVDLVDRRELMTALCGSEVARHMSADALAMLLDFIEQAPAAELVPGGSK